MLTKKQRLEAYTYVYFIYLSGEEDDKGVCHHFDVWGIKNVSCWPGIHDLPEWYNQEPQNANPWDFWWPIEDRASRLRALERAIAECEAAES